MNKSWAATHAAKLRYIFEIAYAVRPHPTISFELTGEAVFRDG